MLEMKIGEIKAFKCVEFRNDDNPCEGCTFNDGQYLEGNCSEYDRTFGNCESFLRKDRKDVIFVSIDPNEVIRERIERQIDRFNDNGFVRIASKEGDWICLKASFMKDYLFTLLEVLPEPKEELKDARDAVQD